MTNRYLRSIYEKVLYRHINLYHQPHRSNRLLRTFTLRPELALLVRSLDIDLPPSVVSTPSGQRTIEPTHPARLNALASARNVNSFGLSGAGWLWGEEMKGIRDVVSKMRLTSLGIHGWWPCFSGPDLQYAARVSATLHEVLQGQPGLLNLEHKYSLYVNEAPGVQTPIGIQSSDIAGLRTLNAKLDTFASILPAVGDQLESLVIAPWTDNNSTFSATSLSNLTAVTRRIRKLHLFLAVQRNLPTIPGWHLNFGPALGSFPNIESLRITGILDRTFVLYPGHFDMIFEKVASQITNAPNLTKLEISFESKETRCEPDPSGLYEVREELRLNLKRSCPSLKWLIDPARQEWVFLPTDEEGGGDAFQAIKVGRLYQNRTQFREGDLPGLEWDV